MTTTPDTKLPLTSETPLESRLAALKNLVPEAFSEDRINFDKLKSALGDVVETSQERYGLTWAGKSEAIRAVQIPSKGTLEPVPEASVNFDDSQNLIIEGDNLEVLKLLQKSYYGQVKMIYIDPPYNKDADVIYPDNFQEGLEDYLIYSGQRSDDGTRLSTNEEAGGRKHSRWLTMMYPRLYLARNLLREDGVVFVSIDDVEVTNLSALLNEIFGEENKIGIISWRNATDNNPTLINKDNEFILCYGRNKSALPQVWRSRDSEAKEVLLSEYRRLKKEVKEPEFIEAGIREFIKDNLETVGQVSRYRFVDRHGVYTGSESVHNPKPGGYDFIVLHPETRQPMRKPANGYRFPESTFRQMEKDKLILYGEDEKRIVKIKKYLEDFEDTLRSVITMDGRLGSYDLKRAFDVSSNVFTNPKPVDLLSKLVSFVTEPNKNEIILDLFAGSDTTAESVERLNRTRAENRRYILVQLPEKTDYTDYPTIADITRERVRRVIAKLNKADEGKLEPTDRPDRSFKAFRLTASNFKVWDADNAPQDAAALEAQLDLFTENVTGEKEPSVLYELVLKSGFPLTAKIERLELSQPVYAVEGKALYICLADPVTQETLAAVADAKPERFVCLDVGFDGKDELKTNTVLQMRNAGIVFHTV